MAVYNFVVALRDETSGPAKHAADSISQLNAKMRAGQQAMLGLTEKMHGAQAAFRAIKDPTKEQTTAFKESFAGLVAQRAALSDHSRQLGVSRTAWAQYAKQVQTAADESSNRSKRMNNAIQAVADHTVAAVGVIVGAFQSLAHGDVVGAIGGLTSGIAGAMRMLDLAVPGLGSALAMVTGIVGSLAGALVGGVAALGKFALGAAEGHDRAVTLFDALADGHATGEQVTAMIGKMVEKTGMAKASLSAWSKELLILGHRDLPDLRRELLAAASAEAIVGKGGGDAYANMLNRLSAAKDASGKIKIDTRFERQLKGIGVSVGDVAKAMGLVEEKLKGSSVEADKLGDALREAVTNKGKKPLEQFRNSLEGIGNRMMANLEKIFSKVDVKPFLDALNEIVGAFELNTKSGDGMVSALNQGFKAAGGIVKWLVLAVLDAAGWITNGVADIIEAFQGIGSGNAIVDGVVASFKAMALVVESIIGPMKALVELIHDAGDFGRNALGIGANDSQIAYQATITKAIADMNAKREESAKAGQALAQGLADGILAGTPQVTIAGMALGKAANDAVRAATETHSPSRVFMRVGAFAAQGFAEGVRGGTPDAGRAVSDMSRHSIASANDNGGAAGGRGGRGGDLTINGGLHVHVDGEGKDGKEIAEEAVAVLFERLRLAAGA